MSARPYGSDEFLSEVSSEKMDETVTETFEVMLGLTVKAGGPPCETAGGGDERTGLIGLSGALRGSCEVRMSSLAARAIATAMLGSPVDEEDDDSINDSVGEICNMVAAGWKNRIDALAGRCFLSPPTVISGKGYTLHSGHASVTITRRYEFDGHSVEVTIHCMALGDG